MKNYHVYFSNGKDIRIEADDYTITEQGHLNLFTRNKQGFRKSLYVVASGHWTIIDIAELEGKDD